MFVVTTGFIWLNPNAVALKCVSMSDQIRKVKATIRSINSNKPLFYTYSFLVNKCSGRCNDINDPYVELCIPDITKNINMKVFNLFNVKN